MGSRILAVEDNAIHRLMLQDFLELEAFQVMCLSDGREFLDSVASFQPDLILLDLKLPLIDGFTLLEQLRQSEWAAIPVIVVSAYAFQQEKQRAKTLGARQYFVKPMKFEAIAQAIWAEIANCPLKLDPMMNSVAG